MKTKIHFLILFFVTFSFIFSQPVDQYRLSGKVQPVYQFIHLNIDPDKNDYSGSTRIEINIKESLPEFKLHGKDFEISEISLVKDKNNIDCKYEFQDFGLLKVVPAYKITGGKYILDIKFKGNVSTKSEGISRFIKDSLNYIFTQMEFIYARQAFPCFDEPCFKFPYQVEITAPVNDLVVSNTAEETEIKTGNLKTILFKKTKPMPSYALAFAVGPYETTPIQGLPVPGNIITPKGYIDKVSYCKQITPKIFNSLVNYFSIPYPYEKLDFISVTNFQFGAMENPGLIVYNDDVLIDPRTTLYSKYYTANTITHEISHMWFGNLVTLKWWDETWLNEGFATWITDEIIVKEFPGLNSMDRLYGNFYDYSLPNDVVETIKPIERTIKGNDDPAEMFDALSYNKCAVVLRMLEKWIGTENFKAGLNEYLKKYQWSSTTSENLFTAISSVTNKPVKKVMHDFVMQPGVPAVSAEVKDNSIILSQERLKTVEVQKDFKQLWHIPINIKLSDGKNVYHKQIFLTKEKEKFTFNDIDKIKWIHLKEDVTGYFLMLLPNDILNNALNSGNLTPTEVQDIFTGLKYGFRSGLVKPTDILELCNDLRNTENKAIIVGLASLLYDIKNTFSEKVTSKLFGSYMEQVALPMLDKFGIEPDQAYSSAEINCQSQLISVLDNDSIIVKKITALGRKYLFQDTISENKSIYLAKLFYYYGDDDLYRYVINKLEKTKDQSEREVLLWDIGYFPGKFIEKNLQYTLTANLSQYELLMIPLSISNGLYNIEKINKGFKPKPNILEWYKENEKLFNNNVSGYLIDFILPQYITDAEDVNTFNRLFPRDSCSKAMLAELDKDIAWVRRYKILNEIYDNDIKIFLENFNTDKND